MATTITPDTLSLSIIRGRNTVIYTQHQDIPEANEDQDTEGDSFVSVPEYQLFTNMGHDDPAAIKAIYTTFCCEESLVKGGIQKANDPLDYDQTIVDAWLDSTVPSDYDGILTLDWEGQVFTVLGEGSSHPDHATVLTNMIELLDYVKTERPSALVGYYGLPLREYWGQDIDNDGDGVSDWRQAMLDAQTLFDAMTAIFPSVYDFYACSDNPSNPNYQCARDHEKFGNIVNLALELASGTPVFIYMWHRYHNSTSIGYQLIPTQEIIQHIQNILAVSFNDIYPKGVIAWGAEKYYFNQAFLQGNPGYCGYNNCGANWDRIRAAYNAEMEDGETIDEYLLRLMDDVYGNYAIAIGCITKAFEKSDLLGSSIGSTNLMGLR